MRERAEAIPLQFRDDPLLWAGWLHAHDGLTQQNIARIMGVSRATVNGYLAQARARGLVSLSVEPSQLGAVAVAQALKQRFGVGECIVVPDDDGSRDIDQRLGEAAGAVLRNLVRPGDTIAISWGATMMALARSVGTVNHPDVTVIQAIGGVAAGIEFSSDQCASRLAEALSARCISLTMPAIVSSAEMRALLMREPLVAGQLDRLKQADKIVFGISAARRGGEASTCGMIGESDMAPYEARRATAFIAGRFIDERGTPVLAEPDTRMTGLTIEELRPIRTRIAVAGGPEKVPAILACLRGGLATILITDASTGRSILRADEAPDLPEQLRSGRRTQATGGSSMRTKKLINNPKSIIEEMLEGVVSAHPAHVRQVEGSPRAVIAVDGPRQGKVGLVIGGGSGHEPTFVGFVGKGLADACAVGNVFASPPPDPIVECAKAAHGGAGVMFMYGNYAGDVMNFDMAAELAALDGIEVRTILTTDDVASAPRDQREKRRGVAGNFFVFKIAGAAADKMLSLDECERLARKANDRTFTVGVALSPCSLPHTLRPNFEIGDGDMEVGMGIHGEPGVSREPIRSADDVTDDMLERIFAELPSHAGDKVAVLINSLGSTPLMELYLICRRVHQRLADKGIAVHATWVGPYCTSLEMAGASVTLIALDDELTELLDRPCECAMFRAG